MDNNLHHTNADFEFWIRPGTKFEDYFNMKTVCPDKIEFARHYMEDKLGYDVNEDSLIDFSAIGIKLFGSMLVDIVLEYESYTGTRMDG